MVIAHNSNQDSCESCPNSIHARRKRPQNDWMRFLGVYKSDFHVNSRRKRDFRAPSCLQGDVVFNTVNAGRLIGSLANRIDYFQILSWGSIDCYQREMTTFIVLSRHGKSKYLKMKTLGYWSIVNINNKKKKFPVCFILLYIVRVRVQNMGGFLQR